jgi:hypothetical protein
MARKTPFRRPTHFNIPWVDRPSRILPRPAGSAPPTARRPTGCGKTAGEAQNNHRMAHRCLCCAISRDDAQSAFMMRHTRIGCAIQRHDAPYIDAMRHSWIYGAAYHEMAHPGRIWRIVRIDGASYPYVASSILMLRHMRSDCGSLSPGTRTCLDARRDATPPGGRTSFRPFEPLTRHFRGGFGPDAYCASWNAFPSCTR